LAHAVVAMPPKKIKFDAIKRLVQIKVCKPKGAIPFFGFATDGLKNNECIFNTRVWSDTRLVTTLFHFQRRR